MVDIQHSVSLAPYTTFGIGGKAEHYCVVESIDELQVAIQIAKENDWAITVLGGGSNVLIADEGVRGLVLHIRIKGVTFSVVGEEIVAEIGAGEVLDEVIARIVEKGYWGLENLSLIPGSVGAVPIQNVGAYGVEAKEYIRDVEIISKVTGEVRVLSNDECQFGYRSSFFKTPVGQKWIVTKVTFVLRSIPSPKITYKDLAERFGDTSPTLGEVRQAVIEIRQGKFPDWQELGTAGSFFKNPVVDTATAERLLTKYPDIPHFETDAGQVKLSLSWMLDHILDIKGERVGQVGTYKKHVLVLVNHGEATASALSEYAKSIKDRLYSATGLEIEWEVTPLP